MARRIQCVVLKREADGLDYLPYPGELGMRIYASVSKEAWAQWVAHQTMLINENRLTPIEPKARAFLVKEMKSSSSARARRSRRSSCRSSRSEVDARSRRCGAAVAMSSRETCRETGRGAVAL